MNKLVIFNYLIIRSMLILLFSAPQTIGAELTDGYLKDLLHNCDCIDVHVSCMTGKRPMLV
jgi:hypothetical protein